MSEVINTSDLKLSSMKTIEINLYKFAELSEEAKEMAISKYDCTNDADFTYNELHDSVKEMAGLFGLKFGREYSDLKTDHIEDDILNLSGVRLYKYLVNNYYDALVKPKYIKTINRRVAWKPFVCKQYKGTVHAEYTQIYSKNFKDSDCVLTGMTYDNDVLQPVYEFLNKPTKDTFEDLINDISNAVSKVYRDTEEYYSSRQYIQETLEANDFWDFTEDGELY